MIEKAFDMFDENRGDIASTSGLRGAEKLSRLIPHRNDDDTDKVYVLKRTLTGGAVGAAAALVNNKIRPSLHFRYFPSIVTGTGVGALGAIVRNKIRDKKRREEDAKNKKKGLSRKRN